MNQYNTEKRREYQTSYRVRRNAEARLRLGDRCAVCGTTENLQFNHIDPRTKLFNISGYSGSLESFWLEVAKCNLLCHTHHVTETALQKEAGLVPVKKKSTPKHGTLSRYNEGCRCDDCRSIYSNYKKEYRKRRGQDVQGS